MPTLQLNLIDVLPPAATIPVKLWDGSLTEGTVGLLSSSETGKRGWAPDPQGTHYLISWHRHFDESERRLSDHLGIPWTPPLCGLYICREHLTYLLENGLPFDWDYQSRLRWEQRCKGGRIRGTRDDEPGEDD